ncbi:hypothetical protein [uncultured Jatrophihabitans sp.]|uniref:hypothetical protein n=1 Tax=uncultured Jatrophihabitans sp. TaxID=1610747 RepID=UPI0035CB4354
MAAPAAPRRIRPTGRDVRQHLMGLTGGQEVRVVRQAYRIRQDDTDEVSVFANARDYWVAARIGDRVSVWACGNAAAADDKAERLADGEGWTWAGGVTDSTAVAAV